MKKIAVIILVAASFISIFAACSLNGNSGDNFTTAVTDTKGQTHYYEVVTNENSESVTDSKGSKVYAEIVTDKDKSYVTQENTTVFNDKGEDTSISEKSKNNTADNEVTFSQNQETSSQAAETTESTTKNNITTQSVTDKDGWINKWY